MGRKNGIVRYEKVQERLAKRVVIKRNTSFEKDVCTCAGVDCYEKDGRLFCACVVMSSKLRGRVRTVETKTSWTRDVRRYIPGFLFLRELPVIVRTLKKLETKPDVDLRKTLAQTVINNNWGLYELRSEGMSLEEIFLKLTTKE